MGRSPSGEPLWLPAGWLAAVLLLTAAAPALGDSVVTVGADGWRARGTTPRRVTTAQPQRRLRPIQQVAYEDDIAGPRLRVAGRMDLPGGARRDGRGYRIAQQDSGDALRDALGQPFVAEPAPRPSAFPRGDADEADRLFDELPPEPDAPRGREPQEYDPYADDSPEQQPRRSLFDDDPSDPEPVPAGDRFSDDPYDVADDLGSPYDGDDAEDVGVARERERAFDACRDEFERLRAATIDTVDLNIRVSGDEGTDYPYACRIHEGSVFTPRMWCDITYMWKASGLCHKPLYFEDVHLERYGHSHGPYLQPLVSGAHFFGTLPILPYKIGLKTPNECVYTLGHYRPGSCAPYLLDPIPFTWRAALFQGAGAVGVAAFLP